MSYLIHKPSQSDIDLMVFMARDIDRFEFDVMSGKPFDVSLPELITRSGDTVSVAYVDGDLVAIYGCCAPTVLSLDANPWMVATPAIAQKNVRRVFLENSAAQLRQMSASYTRLWNMVSADNKIAIRWLKWLGFQFEVQPYRVSGHKFLMFHMEKI